MATKPTGQSAESSKCNEISLIGVTEDSSCNLSCDSTYNKITPAEKNKLSTLLGSVSTPVPGLDANALSGASLDVFKKFRDEIIITLDTQYKKTRITGNEYVQAMVPLLQTAMQISIQSTAELSGAKIAAAKLKYENISLYANATKTLKDRDLSAIQASETRQSGIYDRASKKAEMRKTDYEASYLCEQDYQLALNSEKERAVQDEQIEVYKKQADLYGRQKEAYDEQYRIDAYKAALDFYAVYGSSIAKSPPATKAKWKNQAGVITKDLLDNITGTGWT